MIESLRKYLLECVYFKDLKKIGVDFLSTDVNSATIEKTPLKPVLKSYMDGSKLKQAGFILKASFSYNEMTKQTIENSEFFENFTDWLEEQVSNNNFPTLKGTDKEVTDIYTSSSDYLVSVNPNARVAYYQIQIIMEYKKTNKNNPFEDFF